MLKIETVLLLISALLFLFINVRFMLNKGKLKDEINLNFLLFNVALASSCIIGIERVPRIHCVMIFTLSCACFCVANFGIYEVKKTEKFM